MEQILILDFGSQYTQLIARRLRNLKIYCEIKPFDTPLEEIRKDDIKGVIFSGGPQSVYSKDAPGSPFDIATCPIPILGICYGMQLISRDLGGDIKKAAKREYGLTKIRIKGGILFKGIKKELSVWMSHGDEVKSVPPEFNISAQTENGLIAAMEKPRRNLYAIQFHPEVYHSESGIKILENFAKNICGIKEFFDSGDFIKNSVKEIKKTAGKEKVICALSGGVDSSVAAVLAHKALGKKLNCVFVDTGLLRAGDRERIKEVFEKKFGFNIKIADAAEYFLKKLNGVSDPEKKRKIIGAAFIDVFKQEAKKIKGAKFLLQGTLYPDIIESVSVKGPSAVIKSHHNVGGLPKQLGFSLIEPFKFLFKDEVREIGEKLNIPKEILYQHPFPGPGLAIRIIGEVNKERLNILRQADLIMREEIIKAGVYYDIWQAFCVLLPVKSVGVMGDERSYENALAIRCVDSVDGMTADWSKLNHSLLGKISSRIISEVRGINRVVYDITSKPPATIEWE